MKHFKVTRAERVTIERPSGILHRIDGKVPDLKEFAEKGRFLRHGNNQALIVLGPGLYLASIKDERM